MNNTTRIWTKRILASCFLLIGLLVGIVLNPALLYAKSTQVGNWTVWHNGVLSDQVRDNIAAAQELIAVSELSRDKLKLEICLNDGSQYPHLISMLGGRAFARGFYNKVVLMGETDKPAAFVRIGEYPWNMVELLAHEAIHCLQFDSFGLLKSNPIAGYPDWKWEGYPEYIARQKVNGKNLSTHIENQLNQTEKDPDGWAFELTDGSIAPRNYYKAWLLMQYCLDIKKMSYAELLADNTSENALQREMMNWYHLNRMAKR